MLLYGLIQTESIDESRNNVEQVIATILGYSSKNTMHIESKYFLIT